MDQDLYGLQASGIDPEIAAQMLGLKRSRGVAEALLKQSMTPLSAGPTPQGGFTPRIHPLQGIAQIVQAYMARKGLEDADTTQAGLAKQNEERTASALGDYEKQRAGTPEITNIPDAGPGDADPATSTISAKAGDPRAAIANLLAKNAWLSKNPLVQSDMAAMKPMVLGRTLVNGTGQTLATDSTWAAEQKAAAEAKKAAQIDSLAAKEEENRVKIEAAAERQRQAAADRENLIRIAGALKGDQNKPPSGYRKTAEGNLEAIPGGPADKPILTKGQEAVDRNFGKEYAEYQAGGGSADVEKQLKQLETVSKELGKEGNNYTGSVRGLLPDKLRAITNSDAIAAKNKVEEVAQRNLRLVLGAQFTQVEGERLIARAYNDQMSPKENKTRVDALLGQIREAAKTKEDAARYFEQNGTLAGWKGRMPTLSDFESAIDSAGQNRRASDKNTVLKFDAQGNPIQ